MLIFPPSLRLSSPLVQHVCRWEFVVHFVFYKHLRTPTAPMCRWLTVSSSWLCRHLCISTVQTTPEHTRTHTHTPWDVRVCMCIRSPVGKCARTQTWRRTDINLPVVRRKEQPTETRRCRKTIHPYYSVIVHLTYTLFAALSHQHSPFFSYFSFSWASLLSFYTQINLSLSIALSLSPFSPPSSFSPLKVSKLGDI